MYFSEAILERSIQLSIEATINGLWQGVLLTMIVWCALCAAKRTNATTRHVVWLLTLVVVALLPLLQLAKAYRRQTSIAFSSSQLTPSSFAPDEKDETAAPFQDTVDMTMADDQMQIAHDQSESSFKQQDPFSLTDRSVGSATTIDKQEVRSAAVVAMRGHDAALLLPPLPPHLSLLVMLLWPPLTTVFAWRIWRSLLHVGSIKKRSSPLPTDYQCFGRQILAESRCRRGVVRTSNAVSMPMAVGFKRPMIILPEPLLSKLSAEEFRLIVLHEVAHLMRRDDWTKLMTEIIKSLLFFHPAVLWLDRQLTKEREMAADDFVLAVTEQGRGYATCLMRLLELQTSQKSVLLASDALLPRKHLLARVRNILDRDRRPSSRLSKRKLLVPFLITLAFILSTSLLPVLAFPEGPNDGKTTTIEFALDSAAPNQTPDDARSSMVEQIQSDDAQNIQGSQIERKRAVDQERKVRTDGSNITPVAPVRNDSKIEDQEQSAPNAATDVVPPMRIITVPMQIKPTVAIPRLNALTLGGSIHPVKPITSLMKPLTLTLGIHPVLGGPMTISPILNNPLSPLKSVTQNSKLGDGEAKQPRTGGQETSIDELKRRLAELQNMQESIRKLNDEIKRANMEAQTARREQTAENWRRANEAMRAAQEKMREADRRMAGAQRKMREAEMKSRLSEERLQKMQTMLREAEQRQRLKFEDAERKIQEAQKKMRDSNARPTP